MEVVEVVGMEVMVAMVQALVLVMEVVEQDMVVVVVTILMQSRYICLSSPVEDACRFPSHHQSMHLE